MKSYLVKKPIITEKSLGRAQGNNVYTFEVDRSANKNQIKQAIEKMFEVEVVSINTTTKYRVRKATGKKRMQVLLAPVKKAMVTLKKGQSINLFDFGGSEDSSK